MVVGWIEFLVVFDEYVGFVMILLRMYMFCFCLVVDMVFVVINCIKLDCMEKLIVVLVGGVFGVFVGLVYVISFVVDLIVSGNIDWY